MYVLDIDLRLVFPSYPSDGKWKIFHSILKFFSDTPREEDGAEEDLFPGPARKPVNPSTTTLDKCTQFYLRLSCLGKSGSMSLCFSGYLVYH